MPPRVNFTSLLFGPNLQGKFRANSSYLELNKFYPKDLGPTISEPKFLDWFAQIAIKFTFYLNKVLPANLIRPKLCK
jgi:hypothetical protein